MPSFLLHLLIFIIRPTGAQIELSTTQTWFLEVFIPSNPKPDLSVNESRLMTAKHLIRCKHLLEAHPMWWTPKAIFKSIDTFVIGAKKLKLIALLIRHNNRWCLNWNPTSIWTHACIGALEKILNLFEFVNSFVKSIFSPPPSSCRRWKFSQHIRLSERYYKVNPPKVPQEIRNFFTTRLSCFLQFLSLPVSSKLFRVRN